jgi:hypothetical protein
MLLYYNRRERSPWRDTMQVCLNGHVINAGSQEYPQYNKDFCDECGAKTITNCPKCNAPIPGDMQDTGVAVIGFKEAAPDYCQSCGTPFPWTERKTKMEESTQKERPDPLLMVEHICSRFHLVARQLRERYHDRPTLDISDEYDVQNLLHALLKIHFDDIRTEEWTPSYAGGSSRMDFLLKKEKIVIEVKKTRVGLGNKELGDQLLVDIGRYQTHPDCNVLFCFVYDPDGRISNPQGIEKDLTKEAKEITVRVLIVPKGY